MVAPATTSVSGRDARRSVGFVVPVDTLREGRLDAALAKSGMPRSERRKLISEIKTSTSSAAGGDTLRAVVPGKPSAALDVSAFEETANQASALRGLIPAC